MKGKKIDLIVKNSELQNNIYEPILYRLGDRSDSKRFAALVSEQKNLIVTDELQGQLQELVKMRNPKINFTKDQLIATVKNHIANIPAHDYGVWVFYPWSNRLVHLLDEKEFIEVRTTRNQYKITQEERAVLSQKKIGVIGLSVGQSVAVTIAQERSCGEIRLADFDILELSNLNRIRTGVHNLGLLKVVVTSREIAEIDPFLKVTCFKDGLTEKNMESFFLENGKMDICIDECDGFAMKISCRLRARALGIAIVMEASDRGTIDVERFDLEPNRPILHGKIDHLDLEKAKKAKTNEEKIPFLLPILGLDTTSNRMKASILEIEQTITSWPQLASAVTLGGGITADVCRRILLDQFHSSGRFFVDLEELICDAKTDLDEISAPEKKIPRKLDSFTDTEMSQTINNYEKTVLKGQLELSDNVIETLIEAAASAPSGGNSQPWKFIWRKSIKKLFLFFDESRSHSLLDFESKASYLAIGAAAENLVLKAHDLNLEVMVDQFPIEANQKLVVVFQFFKEIIPELKREFENHDSDELADSIFKRCTNRNIGKREEIKQEQLVALEKITNSVPGADLKILNSKQQLFEMGEIMAKLDRILLTNQQGHECFMNEIRWTIEEVEKTRDGVDLATIDLTASEKAGFKIAKKWEVIKYLNLWKSGSIFEKLTRKNIAASSAVCLITMPNNSIADFFNGGRAVQRVWLSANQKNISFQPFFVAISFFARYAGKEKMPADMLRDINLLRKEFNTIFSIDESTTEIFLFNLSINSEPKVKSLRRLLKDILYIEN
jgi:molybdopterin/thiamine biosynthesis adenylyltransferase